MDACAGPWDCCCLLTLRTGVVRLAGVWGNLTRTYKVASMAAAAVRVKGALQ